MRSSSNPLDLMVNLPCMVFIGCSSKLFCALFAELTIRDGTDSTTSYGRSFSRNENIHIPFRSLSEAGGEQRVFQDEIATKKSRVALGRKPMFTRSSDMISLSKT